MIYSLLFSLRLYHIKLVNLSIPYKAFGRIAFYIDGLLLFQGIRTQTLFRTQINLNEPSSPYESASSAFHVLLTLAQFIDGTRITLMLQKCCTFIVWIG